MPASGMEKFFRKLMHVRANLRSWSRVTFGNIFQSVQLAKREMQERKDEYGRSEPLPLKFGWRRLGHGMQELLPLSVSIGVKNHRLDCCKLGMPTQNSFTHLLSSGGALISFRVLKRNLVAGWKVRTKLKT